MPSREAVSNLGGSGPFKVRVLPLPLAGRKKCELQGDVVKYMPCAAQPGDKSYSEWSPVPSKQGTLLSLWLSRPSSGAARLFGTRSPPVGGCVTCGGGLTYDGSMGCDWKRRRLKPGLAVHGERRGVGNGPGCIAVYTDASNCQEDRAPCHVHVMSCPWPAQAHRGGTDASNYAPVRRESHYREQRFAAHASQLEFVGQEDGRLANLGNVRAGESLNSVSPRKNRDDSTKERKTSKLYPPPPPTTPQGSTLVLRATEVKAYQACFFRTTSQSSSDLDSDLDEEQTRRFPRLQQQGPQMYRPIRMRRRPEQLQQQPQQP
ncbi:hypothetical protein B0T26DRAFT_806845 [Lasiosphaeria miniovina]|uniref:Uncharacterized protein n=1 Tax=Lasiosphaeria miniovina TaxID=1954250 RepID=A0AA39ZT96_9PEZI|nr:uncharacterized protein B0T26DRAFT_806845 [Lasiosphaeria miniovina]KAK0703104.1 hypothetical protein B0T26DRAFT_806845 [Lasiosphaeria miniovina]